MDQRLTAVTIPEHEVGQRTASVTPNAASKTYGAAGPAFSGTLAGFLAPDNVTAT